LTKRLNVSLNVTVAKPMFAVIVIASLMNRVDPNAAISLVSPVPERTTVAFVNVNPLSVPEPVKLSVYVIKSAAAGFVAPRMLAKRHTAKTNRFITKSPCMSASA
jgi:hypothetical protein